MKDTTALKLTTTICGTVIIITMLLTDGTIASSIAAACAAGCFGVGGYLAKKVS